MSLSENQRARYLRNVLIPGFGEVGQESLANARVLVVGLGGLGSPAAYYLAAAGVGTLGLMDADTVEVSNLQRQILHTTADIGRPKTESAREKLTALNPELKTETFASRLTSGNAADLIVAFDAVVEATDNFEAEFLINDTCVSLKKPFATAGILSLSGQAQFVVPGQSACLRCVLPEAPEGVPTTAELGVLGAIPGVLGSLEAAEVIRWLLGMWEPQPDGAGLVHGFDGDAVRLRTVRVPRRTDCLCASVWSTT
ncbi:MAG: adenylyltransferase [Nitrospiraceae bacterium]|nr:adenylyltransferase [Nitrospiraceae bacterium]